MNIDELQKEIEGYQKQKEAIQKEIEFKKLFLKSLDKKIKAVEELMQSVSGKPNIYVADPPPPIQHRGGS